MQCLIFFVLLTEELRWPPIVYLAFQLPFIELDFEFCLRSIPKVQHLSWPILVE